MDVIITKAKKFAEEFYLYGLKDHEIMLESTNRQLSMIDENLDKIKFLNTLLERNNEEDEKHLLGCKDPECDKDYQFKSLAYYLQQELSRHGVQINSDAFSAKEKKETESKLDEIFNSLENLKAGQQVLFEELNELRNLYFLGKKKWYQLLLGKSTEMVAAGIISETVSKHIIESVKPFFPYLLSS